MLYQNELPYDPPSQAEWTGPTAPSGWAGYKVGDDVHAAPALRRRGLRLQPQRPLDRHRARLRGADAARRAAAPPADGQPRAPARSSTWSTTSGARVDSDAVRRPGLRRRLPLTRPVLVRPRSSTRLLAVLAVLGLVGSASSSVSVLARPPRPGAWRPSARATDDRRCRAGGLDPGGDRVPHVVGPELVEEARAGQHVAHVAEDAHEVEVDAASPQPDAASARAVRRWSCPSGWSPRGRARPRAGGRCSRTRVSMRWTTGWRWPRTAGRRGGARRRRGRCGAWGRWPTDPQAAFSPSTRPISSIADLHRAVDQPQQRLPDGDEQPVERAEHEHADERHDGGDEVVAAHRGIPAERRDADQPPHGVDDDRRQDGTREVREQAGGEERRSRARGGRPRPRSPGCRRRPGRWRRSSTATRRRPSRRRGRRRGRRRRARRTPGCRCRGRPRRSGAKVRTAARPSAMPTAAIARPPVTMPLHSGTSTIGIDGRGCRWARRRRRGHPGRRGRAGRRQRRCRRRGR